MNAADLSTPPTRRPARNRADLARQLADACDYWANVADYHAATGHIVELTPAALRSRVARDRETAETLRDLANLADMKEAQQ